MHADFERAAFALAVGEVSGLVETPFGIHIIERRSLVEVRLGHVLVQWAGLRRASTTRTQEEARQRAETAHTRLTAGEPLATVAGELSDGATGVRGGELGWFQTDHVMPQFSPAFALGRGDISAVIETAFGYHVMVRLE
jgi:parvulin-like peptidyl-prolyl isomerase